MKITAWDKKRKQYIPQGEFAITGGGKLLIQLNESSLLYPAGIPSGNYAENEEISAEDIVLTIEDAHYRQAVKDDRDGKPLDLTEEEFEIYNAIKNLAKVQEEHKEDA